MVFSSSLYSFGLSKVSNGIIDRVAGGELSRSGVGSKGS